MTQCPCGSSRDYDACCGPIIAGSPAATAEVLMRSRYTAYTESNIDYLVATMAPESRDEFEPVDAENTAAKTQWQRLEMRAVTGGGPDDETGTVEFVAHYSVDGEPGFHHERTDFRREEGRWVCVDGEVNPKPAPRQVSKVGRNDPCPCGSGKKFKKCCASS